MINDFLSFLNDATSLWGLIDFIPTYLRVILVAVLGVQIVRSFADIVT